MCCNKQLRFSTSWSSDSRWKYFASCASNKILLMIITEDFQRTWIQRASDTQLFIITENMEMMPLQNHFTFHYSNLLLYAIDILQTGWTKATLGFPLEMMSLQNHFCFVLFQQRISNRRRGEMFIQRAHSLNSGQSQSIAKMVHSDRRPPWAF